MKIVIIGNFSETAKQRIGGQFPPEWKVFIVAAGDSIPELADADVVIPEHIAIDGAFLDRARKLRLVQTGAGFDNVVIPECTKRGIHVANAAGVNTVAVAEHVMALLLSWYKNIPFLDGLMKKGGYSEDYSGSELAGKVMGIVGMGNIGNAVARRALAFDMEILGYDVRSVELGQGIRMTDFDTLLRKSDVVTLHTFLNERTRHLIGRRELALMKPDAFLINTSRGPIVEEAALIDALRERKIAGAGLDVYDKEPLSRESPLRSLDNVILTPHTAGMPEGLRFHKKRYAFFIENIRRVSRGEAPLSALNEIQPGKP